MRRKMYSKVLVNKPGRQILLTAVQKNTEIDSFQCNDSVTFQVIEGKLKLRKPKESIVINEGQLFSLYENPQTIRSLRQYLTQHIFREED